MDSRKSINMTCVNCELCVNHMWRRLVVELDTRVISIISQWISPQILTDTDYICKSCWSIAMKAVNQQLHKDVSGASGRLVGSAHKLVSHSHVCIQCGRSILRRRSDIIIHQQPDETQKLMYEIISDTYAPRVITFSDRLCHNCWLQVRRRAKRIQQATRVHEKPVTLNGTVEVELEEPETFNGAVGVELEESKAFNEAVEVELEKQKAFNGAVEVEVEELIAFNGAVEVELKESKAFNGAVEVELEKQKAFNGAVEVEVEELMAFNGAVEVKPLDSLPYNRAVQEPVEPVEFEVDGLEEDRTILLNNYKRAADTARRCLIPKCQNKLPMHRISEVLRATILSDHRFYIPKRARICDEHMRNNRWDRLYQSPTSLSAFSVEHIEHIFGLSSKKTSLDFDDVLSIDDNLFIYLFGTSKGEFQMIIDDVPALKTMDRGTCGLAALLAKFGADMSDDKLSSLFKVPLQTLLSLMRKVRLLLEESNYSICEMS